MQGAQILRNEAYMEVRCNDKGCTATQPFGFTQGHESFDLAQDRESSDFAQDRELVERLVERPVEWPFGFAQGRELVERQMDFLRSRQDYSRKLCESSWNTFLDVLLGTY
jgi:hypothetical protein